MARRTSGRDLIDGMVDAWLREMPDPNGPGYELARRAVRVGVLLEDALAPVLASRNLTKADYGVLTALRLVGAPYELRPSDLKIRLLLTSGGVTTVLKRLEKAGLIEREQDTTDGRSSWVRLTSTGIETAGATMQAWSEAESRFFRAAPPEVLQAASDTLRDVLVAIGDLEPPTPQTRKRRTRSSQKASLISQSVDMSSLRQADMVLYSHHRRGAAKGTTMTVFPVGRATRFTLRESVIDQLRTAIGDGTLAAGTHLAEVDLSSSLGVSRATLREALRQLQQEGLLVQDQRGRVSVRCLTGSEVHDIFEVRTGLEQIAIGRLCVLPDRESVVAALRGKLDRLKYQVSLAEDLDADLNFHGTMCELAGNQALYQAWSNISGLVRVTMVAAGPKPARENMEFERHCPIVDLIAAGDAAAAHRFLAEHMATAAQLLVSRMTETAAL